MTSIKFAIVTDTHLGYEETDSILQNDSFDAFEEALDIAEEEKVDFILHAGDMYNAAAPSPSTIVKTNQILLKHSYTIPNDSSQINPYRCTDANGEVNVKLPIFVISGNHDQPSGANLTSPCEIPESCQLIYYFEKFIDTPKFNLKPVMIERGNITVAIYGLTYINNDHFISLLKNTIDLSNNPILEFDNPPAEDSDSRRYNILLVHQDRPARGNKNLEAPHLLSKICPWMDLIVWGHEHDNKTTIEKSFGLNIIQPGSTIITQFKKYEEPKRGIDIIELFEDEDDIRFRNIELKTSRSYIFDELDLTKIKNFNIFDTKAKESKIRDKIEELIDQNANQDKLPLIRLSIISSPSVIFNDVPYKQICFEFSDRVANPNSIINISKRKDSSSSSSSNDVSAARKESLSKEPDFNSSPSSVEESLSQSFSQSPLEILLVDTLNKSLTGFVSGDGKSFDRNVKNLIEERVNYLIGLIPQDEVGLTPDEAAKFIDSNRPNFPSYSVPDHPPSPKTSKRKATVEDDDDDDESDEVASSKPKTRGRGRGRGGARGGARGGRKSKAAENQSISEDEISNNDDSDDTPPPLPPKTKKPARRKAPSVLTMVQK